jgi:SAM-dependent methyltransferase
MIGGVTATEDFAGWVRRWETQQDRYPTDREERFHVMLDIVESVLGPEPGTVLDLGCGPGSLSIRLLERFPSASVVGVDLDPVLLTLARGAYGDRPRLRFVTADLREPGWATTLGLDAPVDAAVSTTALHWLETDALTRLYQDLAVLLRPGGVLVDGDHARFEGQPRLAAAAGRIADVARERRRNERAEGETWEAWWEAVRADPVLAEAVAERDRIGHAHHGRPALRDRDDWRLLEEAGFAEAGNLWQIGADRILVAVR